MRGAPKTMSVLRPRSAGEAVKIYAKTPHAVPLAGGTDFMVVWNMGMANGKTILDISNVREWKKIETFKDCVRLGALVTHSEIQENPVIRARFPLLMQACATIGALAIQNRGTLGGNIANASPAGDTFPPLCVYEAVVHAASLKGKRRIPMSEIFTGVKKTRLEAGELIEAVEIPYPARRPSRQFFRKVGTRAAQALSKVVAAGLLWLDRAGRVEELRVALGSVAPTVRRLKEAEGFLRGKKLTREMMERACELVRRDISPIDDIRSTAEYRLKVTENLLRSFLE